MLVNNFAMSLIEVPPLDVPAVGVFCPSKVAKNAVLAALDMPPAPT